jgi:hypothetical protein
MEMRVTFRALSLYYQEKRAQYSFYRRLGDSQHQSGRFVDHKHLPPLPGIKP